jgi:uncharacterized protein (TIGR02594 family)
MVKKFIVFFVLAGCSYATVEARMPRSIDLAEELIGLHEVHDRLYLSQYMRIDPVNNEWCAAFVNAVLEEHGIPGSSSVSDYPLMARSFLSWGEDIDPLFIKRGDIVVFPRETWQGHVGFYEKTVYFDEIPYYKILGGNQKDSVQYEFYKASDAIAVRRLVLQNRVSLAMPILSM